MVEIPFEFLETAKFFCLNEKSTFINLNSNKIREIPSSPKFSELQKKTRGKFCDEIHLKYLDLSGNEIAEIPENFFQNFALKDSLFLNGNKIRKINSGSFENFFSDSLDFSENQLEILETGCFRNGKIFGGQQKKKPLDFSRNKLAEIPLKAFQNFSVGALILNENQIEKIPSGISEIFPDLKLFRIEKNPVKKIENLAFFSQIFYEFTIKSNESFEISNGAINGCEFEYNPSFSFSRIFFESQGEITIRGGAFRNSRFYSNFRILSPKSNSL